MDVHISVRNLVEFILRSGDIDNRRFVMAETAMQEGGRIHRKLQGRMGPDYQAEVAVKFRYETEKYTLIIDGRIDGVIVQAGSNTTKDYLALTPPVSYDQIVTIEEIKGTYRDVFKMREPVPVHMAQAMCYSYIYATQHDLNSIRTRMTYCNMTTEDLQYFHQEYTYRELKSWFSNLIGEYLKWADFNHEWSSIRTDTIRAMPFPFEYRAGQKDLVTYVYRTIFHRKKLYLEAPTGVGKTMTTVYPAVKAVGESFAEKVFYLTAKTITRTVAEEAFNQLREFGLRFKTVVLTAKDKICFMSERDCNPVTCPYADGHYDRINDAIYALLTESDIYTRELICEYAELHKVCPFEMSLDMCNFADGIICDYNYLFDPNASLKRFFSDSSNREFVFLIDEAHNLVERGREMYSAVLRKEDFLTLRKAVKKYAPSVYKQLGVCNRELFDLKRDTQNYQVEPFLEPFNVSIGMLAATIEKYLEENENSPVKNDILPFYFDILHYRDTKDNLDDNYVIYCQATDNDEFFVKLFCVNPTKRLRECMQRGRASILFSATMLPINYYKALLGAAEDDYDVYAKSDFDPTKRGVFIALDVTSKYTRRNDTEYYNIARYIFEITKNRHGNYLVFFPSYQFLREVSERYTEFLNIEYYEADLIFQEEYMDENKREQFISRFNAPKPIRRGFCLMPPRNLLGFCVTGGIFSEGIDLKEDDLIGVIVVGTSLPQVCPEREIIKNYFDEKGGSGFDYAYKLPGINKVLQAAGRVIRTKADVGIVALLDERFEQNQYSKFFPHEWQHIEHVKIDEVAKRVEKFWNDWL